MRRDLLSAHSDGIHSGSGVLDSPLFPIYAVDVFSGSLVLGFSTSRPELVLVGHYFVWLSEFSCVCDLHHTSQQARPVQAEDTGEGTSRQKHRRPRSPTNKETGDKGFHIRKLIPWFSFYFIFYWSSQSARHLPVPDSLSVESF